MKLSGSTRKRPRNQRVSNPRQRKQQHLLDVKVRARKATQYRNRRVLVFISKIALAAAICAGIYFGARVGMRRFFFENPDYRLTMIDMQTDGTLQRDQVLKIAARSIFASSSASRSPGSRAKNKSPIHFNPTSLF
ncbi:MAG: hypothetical protein AUG81_11275 [Verrucomicrobia bacterium 13_1_20CM_4_54_11]|nr:MAG: hypothetical protein AUG81_11275 [Verrucomicrobia bacterium 13_1_20CM_4_54_11]